MDSVLVSTTRASGAVAMPHALRDAALHLDQSRFPNGSTVNTAGFAWVPKAHPIGSVVEEEDGHWITFTPGKSKGRNYPPIRLADRQYFVPGDNRDPSADSREFGPVPGYCLIGKVIANFPTGGAGQAQDPPIGTDGGLPCLLAQL